jgi:NitT/TauT family transport system substrate-binding protein
MRRFFAAALALASLSAAGTSLAAEKMTVGIVPSISAGGLYIAVEKGYFSAAGLEVELQNVDSSSDLQMMLGTSRLQVVGGALSAAMLNSIARDLPIKVLYAVAVSPSFHYFMVRADLQDAIKTPADLKSRSIAISGRATTDYYAVGRVLEDAGLSLDNADVTTVPFSEMPAALQNKGIDVAVMIPPLTDAMVARGIAVKFLDPETVLKVKPELIAVGQVNTDWIKEHNAETERYLTALLKGTREFCEAYHFGANRDEVVRILAKYSAIHDPALIARIEWGASDPEGRIPTASIEDFQDFELAQHLVQTKLPIDRIVDPNWVDRAARALGPFTLTHDDGKPGCR